VTGEKKNLRGHAKLKDIFGASKFQPENWIESGKFFILLMKCRVLFINIKRNEYARHSTWQLKNKLYAGEITNKCFALLPLQPNLFFTIKYIE